MEPCPFCGGTDVEVSSDENQGYKWGSGVCFTCSAVGPEVRTGYDKSHDTPWRTEAAAEWNRRASDAEIERLRAALAECCAPYDSEPTTVLDGARLVAAEFQRRMDIAGSALSPLPAPKEPK